LTTVGILLLIGYTWVLIPTVTLEIVGWGLLGALVPTATMIAIHVKFMNARWATAEAFLDGREGPRGPVTGQDALKALMDFPVKMPLWGLLAWAAGGVGTVLGVEIATGWKLLWADWLTLWIGIVSAAMIITIFQFYQWRDIIDPVVGLVIHKRPELLDEDLEVMRVPLKSSLLLTLIPLIVLSLYIAEMAGYRQAAATLQKWVGQTHLEDFKKPHYKSLVARLEDPVTRPAAVRELRQGLGKGDRNVYLIEEREEGEFYELVRDVDFGELYPDLVVKELMKKVDAVTGEGYEFNPFGPEMVTAKKLELSYDGERRTAYLSFGFHWHNYRRQLNHFIYISIALMGTVLLIAVAVVYVVTRDISVPISRLVEFTSEVGTGRIHKDVFFHANDEVGDLALSLRAMSGRLGDVLYRIREAAQSLDQATGAIRQSSESVKDGAKQQEQAIEDVATAMAEMDASIQGIADNVEVLSNSAEESSSSIFEMGAAVKKINESVDILNQSINEVSSSINETTAALDQVAENVSNLSSLSEETASAMAQMDAAIREVEKNTKDTEEWSESVIKDAESGVERVERVSREMNEISDVVHNAQQVIERLGSRVNEIGKIVQVIDDVANQTNLLALNAAIIAAQAGEHGRGFAVVADEIKQLAERTSGSTREIHLLIKGVQEESQQAVGAVEEGTRAVETGVQLASQARTSLAKIMESTQLAIGRVQGIARTTKEQADSSRQVSQAIERVAEMVGQISVATQQQSKGGALVLKATEEMKSASMQVKRNAEEQLQGSRLITKSIENITDMVYSINQAQQEQKNGSAQVVALMERIKVVSQQSTESASRLAEVVEALSHEEETLKQEMRRFEILTNGNEQAEPD